MTTEERQEKFIQLQAVLNEILETRETDDDISDETLLEEVYQEYI